MSGGWFLRGAQQGALSGLSWLPAAAGNITHLCLHLGLASSLSAHPSSPVVGTPAIGSGPVLIDHDLMLTWLHRQRPYFQMRSPSQPAGAGLGCIFLGDTVQESGHELILVCLGCGADGVSHSWKMPTPSHSQSSHNKCPHSFFAFRVPTVCLEPSTCGSEILTGAHQTPPGRMRIPLHQGDRAG